MNRDFEITNLTDRSGILRIQNRLVPFYFLRDAKKIQVWIEGHIYDFETLAQVSSKDSPANLHERPFEIISPMPGKILRVNVKEETHVQTNQSLLVLESMKMEMTVSAPFAAKVQAVLCKVGDLVDMGQLLIRLEASHE